jgi:prepilin-type N-terminal cleavage/methylation domain-containing protein
MFNRKGFTLVELMIVVAIIGILASIAIPNFISMQYKTKRSEIPSNLKAIKTAQIAYESDFDTYVTCAAYPSSPTKTVQAWVDSSSGGFKTIGWKPDGSVRGSYGVSTSSTDFTATGLSDVDGDSAYATYVATKTSNANAPKSSADVY